MLQMSSPSSLRLQFSGASGSPNFKSQCKSFIALLNTARSRLSSINSFTLDGMRAHHMGRVCINYQLRVYVPVKGDKKNE